MSSFFDKTMAMVDGVAVPYDATTDRKRRLSDAESGEPRGAPHKLRINRDECPLDDEDSDVDISIRRILSKASPVPDFANPLGYVDGDKLARELSFDDITDKTEIDKDASEGGEEVHENKHLPKSVWIDEQGKDWAATLHVLTDEQSKLPSDEIYKIIKSKYDIIMDGIIKYKNIAIRAQLEQTKSGGLHYQAWIYTASNYRTSSLRKRIGEYWYKLLKDSDGNVATNEGGARRFWSDYCEKVESRVGPDYIHYNEKWTELCNLSYGDMPRIIRRKGERKDIDNIFAEARRMCLDTDKSAREIRQELATRFPNEYGKYTQGVDKVIELFFKETIYDVPETPWAWQRELIERCEGVPDRRKVLFVVDTKGDVGKSIAVKFLQQKFPGGVLSMDGEIRDMAHLVATHCREMKIAICDIARPTGPGKWEKILELFENVSNGGLFSGKYVPIACTFKKPHIVIFTNKLPTYLPDLISNDRIEIWVPSAAQPYGSGKPTFKFYGKDGFDAYVKKYQ